MSVEWLKRMGLTVLALSERVATANEPICSEVGGVHQEVVLVNSVSGDTLEVEGLTSGLSFYAQWGVRLGALSYQWNTGPHTVPLSGTLVVPVDIPGSAFLHALAEDYLTDLRVRFDGRDGEQSVIRFRSGPLFLAWPEGEEGDVRVWDKETAFSEAPKGIIDEAIGALHAGDTDVTRVVAPLWTVGAPEPDAIELREKGE